MRASVASNGAEITVGYGAFGGPSISADGRFVTFASDAPTLVMGDTNNYFDVFMHDSQTATTTRMSVDSGGAQANQNSGTFGAPSISSDGRFVALASNASNLVPVDQNGFVDVFVRDRGAASAFTHFCLGDGSGAFCPCGNSGGAGRGCQNSTGTGGALLTVSGFASLPVDTVQFISAGELPSAFSIVLQGDSITTPVNFGDGIRCTGGNLKRLYKRSASGGVLIVPQGADPSISARSAALGDAIPLGSTRDYQVYYRDANGTFCPAPVGATFNVSNAIAIAWGA
jgi:hypothetical protein